MYAMPIDRTPMTAAEWDALPPILDVDQAARVLGIGVPTVMRWARDGRIPGEKFGRQWRFSKRVLIEHIEKGPH